MPDTGTQQFLPFPHRQTLKESPDAAFPLAAERAALHQRLDACHHLLAYQGRGPSAPVVIVAIQSEVIRALKAYAAALEQALSKDVETGTAATPRQKRPRQTIPALAGLGAMDAFPSEPSSD